MNVGKIQRLSETHENLEMFLRVCVLSGIRLSANGQGHDKILDETTTDLVLPCLRRGIRAELEGLESDIKKEIQDG